jgi:hypothetical protein
MDASKDAFWDAEGEVATSVEAVGGASVDNVRFLVEDLADDIDTQVPHFGDFLDGVMLLERRSRRQGIKA